MFTATVNGTLSRLGLDPRGTAPLPRSTAPMLMHKADRLVSSPDWTYEPKWDGFRVIATVRDGFVRLLSRKGHSFTRLFGPVSDALRSFPASLVLDGEVVAITDEGRPDFEALQQRLRPRDGKLPGHVCYMIFDCLYVKRLCQLQPIRKENRRWPKPTPSAPSASTFRKRNLPNCAGASTQQGGLSGKRSRMHR